MPAARSSYALRRSSICSFSVFMLRCLSSVPLYILCPSRRIDCKKLLTGTNSIVETPYMVSYSVSPGLVDEYRSDMTIEDHVDLPPLQNEFPFERSLLCPLFELYEKVRSYDAADRRPQAFRRHHVTMHPSMLPSQSVTSGSGAGTTRTPPIGNSRLVAVRTHR